MIYSVRTANEVAEAIITYKYISAVSDLVDMVMRLNADSDADPDLPGWDEEEWQADEDDDDDWDWEVDIISLNP